MARFIRRRAVENRTGLSRSTIYLMMQNGEFPKPVRIGNRAVAWLEGEVDDWINTRLASRGQVAT